MQQQARIRSRVEDLKKLAQEVDIFFTKFGSQIIAYAHPMIVGTSRSVLHCPSQAGCSGITNTTTVFKMQQRKGFNSKDFQASTKAKRFQIRVSKELDIPRQKYFHVLLSLCPGTRAEAKIPGQTPLSRDVPGQNALKFFRKMTRFPVLEHYFCSLDHPFLF